MFCKTKKELPIQLESTLHRIIWGCTLVIAPDLIYSIYLLFSLFCFLMKVLCSVEIQCNEAGLVLFLVVLCYIQSFLFMLSYCFRWFLVFLQYYGSLLQKCMQIPLFCEKWKTKSCIMLLLQKKNSLALAKSKEVDLLPCYCVWLLIFYQALLYDKQNGPSMMPRGRGYFDNSARLSLTTSQKSVFKGTTSMAFFSEMPGIFAYLRQFYL